MEFMLDTANIEEIRSYNEVIHLAGVTTNPSIIKKEGKINFYDRLNEIRKIIGSDKSLHVQVVAHDYEGIIKDANAILENVDKDVFIKVPVSQEGLKAIKVLKDKGVNITATAIYTKIQAYLAIVSGADYLAPYFNRMENQNIDPKAAITEIARRIERDNSSTKILAASFKNINQINCALESGAQAVTVSADLIRQALSMPSISKAVDDFSADWEEIFGDKTTISSLS